MIIEDNLVWDKSLKRVQALCVNVAARSVYKYVASE